MSCKDCEEFQEKSSGSYPYRWGSAVVEILACRKHAKEIFAALNVVQKAKTEQVKP